MSPAARRLIRGAVIVGGASVTLASVLAFRVADWLIYLVFCILSALLFVPQVEVLPGVTLPLPQMAVTIGFLYIGGLPIIALTNVAGALTRVLRTALPRRWTDRLPQLEAAAARELFASSWQAGARLDVTAVAEWATFTLGLGARWWIVAALVHGGAPTAAPWAMGVAEIAGHVAWGLLAILPIYRNGPLLALSPVGGVRTALADIGLVVVLALTPFVFLISYGFRNEGLSGAAVWTLGTVGLHLMLKRLNERRLMLEEQNRRLEALNRELEHRERLSAIGKMSSVVSHQILHQLGVIGVYADLIRNAEPVTDVSATLAQARANAAAIEAALGDVNRVLTDLLVFSKDLRVNLYEHPLARVIEECVEDCRTESAARGVVLQASCPADMLVPLDKLKIKQALVNVLRNAIEASPHGGTVCVEATAADGQVTIAVADEGAGVPAADREAIFAPFFTTKEQGTGLGLAIARQFTEAHGGRLTVEPVLGRRGAQVVFRLPLKLAAASATSG